MTSSSNRPNAVSNIALKGINLILFFHLYKLLIYFLSMTARVRSIIIIVKALKADLKLTRKDDGVASVHVERKTVCNLVYMPCVILYTGRHPNVP